MIVTTSWDDGDARDLRVAELLDRYGMRGTFYVGKSQAHRLSEEEIRALSRRHEIGAHGLTHPDLPTLSREGKRREIAGSKEWLEGVAGKPVEMFCYPFGRFDEETKEAVKEAGFLGARSSIKTLGTVPTDPFALPVTTMLYREPFGFLQRMAFPCMKERLPNAGWEERALGKFEAVRAKGGVFHLWGHSWEIDRLALWGSLETFFKRIARQEEARYLTNGELVQETFG